MTDEEIMAIVKAGGTLKEIGTGMADAMVEVAAQIRDGIKMAMLENVRAEARENDMIHMILTASDEEMAEYLQELKRMAAEDRRQALDTVLKTRWRSPLIRKVSRARHNLRYYPVGYE